VRGLVKWRAVEFRLLLFYCLLLLALGGLFSMFTVVSFDRFEKEALRTDVEDRAGEIWTIGGALLDQPDVLSELLERRFSPEMQNRFIRLSRNGHVLYQSGPPVSRDFDPRTVPLPSRHHPLDGRNHGALYVVAMDFRQSDHEVVTVESGQSTVFVETPRDSLISSLLLGLPILLALAALGGYFLMRQAWAPLSHMIRAAEAITFNDPHNRLPLAGTGDRLDGLAQALNRMLDRLDSTYQHASRFSADAAHELRTPLAIIRGEVEFIAERAELRGELRVAVTSICDEVRRLTDMTSDLLTIANLDSMSGKKEHASVDLTGLASETIEQMNLLAEEKHIRLEAPMSAAAWVSGDRNRLKQVLVNLLDNAIKYTPEGGSVDVQIQSQGRVVQLAVRDTGIGIPARHHEDVFQRFFRVSTDRGQKGAGLGLSIARSICQAHGGTLTVQSTPGSGSEFRLELPVERA
jgi:signal transduction histidine kinase